MASLVNSIKHLRKNYCQAFSNSFKKTEQEKKLTISLYEVSITLTPKQQKDPIERENIGLFIPDKHACPNHQK